MEDAKHPLVGKTISMEGQPGSVTKDLINRTLGKVNYVQDGSWTMLDSQEKNSWTVRHNGDLQITGVERH